MTTEKQQQTLHCTQVYGLIPKSVTSQNKGYCRSEGVRLAVCACWGGNDVLWRAGWLSLPMRGRRVREDSNRQSEGGYKSNLSRDLRDHSSHSTCWLPSPDLAQPLASSMQHQRHDHAFRRASKRIGHRLVGNELNSGVWIRGFIFSIWCCCSPDELQIRIKRSIQNADSQFVDECYNSGLALSGTGIFLHSVWCAFKDL